MPKPQEVILGDQKRLVVDAFARYRIVDPLRFYQSVGDETRLRGRIDTILDASLRKVLGEVPLFTVLSADRLALMNRIRDLANTETKQFGIDVVDVRIKRADLPAENSQAIYRRMQTERDREAKELRAQGAELAQRIRARADRERRVLIAEAQKEAEITRGQGDAEAVRIFADAVGRDVNFFTFYRSMQAYRDALADNNTSFVLSPDSEFFRFFNNPTLPPVEQASGPRPRPRPRAARRWSRRPGDRRPAGGRRRSGRATGRRRDARDGAAAGSGGHDPVDDGRDRTAGEWLDRADACARAPAAGSALSGPITPRQAATRTRGEPALAVSLSTAAAAETNDRGVRAMVDLATAVALVLVLEGLLWAVSPRGMKRAAERALGLADEQLRLGGLVAVALGVLLVWLVRG